MKQFCSKIKQNILGGGLQIQVGHDAFGDVPNVGVVGLPVCLGAVREVGLHQSHGVLHDIHGRSLQEGLQSATGRLQPLRQALCHSHAFRLECPQQSVQLPAEVIQHRLGLGHLALRFCRKALSYISLSDKLNLLNIYMIF